MDTIMERTITGVPGFDELVQGGFPQGSCVLLSGTPGTGKTIFALQYLYNGAVKFGEKGLYITFEQKVEDLQRQAEQFGWDFPTLQKNGMVNLLSISSSDLNKNTVRDIIKAARSSNVKRLVIDSISTLAINAPAPPTGDYGDLRIKHFIYSFLNELKTLNSTTSVVISQNHKEGFLSNDQVSEFLCDGLIHIVYQTLGGQFSRSLTVRKMRRVKNNEDVHPVEISDTGIVIHRLD